MLKPAFIDLSHHNTVPDSLIPARQSGILGVIHKLTESDDYIDSKVDARYALAKEAGMLWGLYHFVRPGDMEAQAEFFLSSADNVSDKNTLYCLDYEDSDVSLEDALDFLNHVQQLTGQSPVLYSGHVLKEALNGKPNDEITAFRLWLAQYGPDYDLPPGYDKLWGWQYTEDGNCPGIQSPVDLNAYNGTAEQLRADWDGSGIAPPAPTPEEIEVVVYAPSGVRVRVIYDAKQGER